MDDLSQALGPTSVHHSCEGPHKAGRAKVTLTQQWGSQQLDVPRPPWPGEELGLQQTHNGV